MGLAGCEKFARPVGTRSNLNYRNPPVKAGKLGAPEWAFSSEGETSNQA